MRKSVNEHKLAHKIVLGNEKGGTGKSTLSMHVIVSLLKAGQSVASIDIDARQGSLTRYVQNRKRAISKYGLSLELPDHYSIMRASGMSVAVNEADEFAAFADVLNSVENEVDFVVIDTPAADTYLNRLAHSMADTLISPMNDSFIDFDVLGRVDPETFEILAQSHYASLVSDGRRQHRMIDDGLTDWILVRNRLSQLDTHNNRNIHRGLKRLALKLGFRIVDGISERVIYREFFPNGLTALDSLDAAIEGRRSGVASVAARQEIRDLIETLRLPIDKRGEDRAQVRRIWAEKSNQPLEEHDIFGETSNVVAFSTDTTRTDDLPPDHLDATANP